MIARACQCRDPIGSPRRRASRRRPFARLADLALALACALPGGAGAAELVVTTLNDDTTAGDGQCTLREAIVAANGNADFQDCAGSGPYGADTISFALSGTLTLGSQLPDVTDANGLTVDGAGQAVTVSGGGNVGVLAVGGGASLTLQNLAVADGTGAADCGGTSCGGALVNLAGGTLRLSGASVSGSRADDGGAIWNSGALFVTDSTLEGNLAENGAGGAVFTAGQAEVTGSTLADNGAAFSGGAIQISSGTGTATLTVTGSLFTGNHTDSTSGGAVDNLGGALVARDSTFHDNHAAASGGGIMSTNGGTLEVTGSTFSANEAAQFGGAIYTDGESTSIANTTIAGNSATGEGGGLVNNSELTATNVTFAGNEGGAVVDGAFGTTTVRNSLLAGSLSGPNCDGTVTDGGGNLDDGTTCGFSEPTSQSDADAGLDPAGLQDHGGPTETIALLAGSDAIDRAVDALCAAEPVGGVDQRGFARPVDGDEDGTPACDVGALEQGAGAAPPSALPHFLCYKARASRGNVCASESASAGAACETEEDCGGQEGATVLCVRNKLPKGLEVALTDRFESDVQLRVKRALDFCAPADKEGEDPAAASLPDHLQAFAIKPAKGEARHERRLGILVQNQFGELHVDTVKPAQLLVPTAASETEPVPEPEPAIDHFACYRVKVTKGTAKFEKRAVSVVDRFGQPRVYDVSKPTELCAPADKNGEAPGAELHSGHLLCYRIKTARGEPKHTKVLGVHLNNQIAASRVDTRKASELCVPSEASP
jgi:CSLREA domain-containing protein